MKSECKKCGRGIWSKQEREQGTCSTCTVAPWTPEKKQAFNTLISMAFRTPKPTDAEKDAAIDEAFKHLGEP